MIWHVVCLAQTVAKSFRTNVLRHNCQYETAIGGQRMLWTISNIEGDNTKQLNAKDYHIIVEKCVLHIFMEH